MLVLIIALTARSLLFLGILLRNDVFFLTDTDGYLNLGDNIYRHAFFSSDNIQPDASRTPLYPFFIALFKWIGLSNAGVIFVQIIISSVTSLFVILITHKLLGDWLPACLAGGIVAIDIPSIVLANCLLTEALFTFLITLSAWYLVLYIKHDKTIALLTSGILLGLSVLCRPIAVYFPFAAAILFLLFFKMPKVYVFRRILAYFISCYIFVVPWLVRNQTVFGSPFLSTVQWHNLLTDRAAGVYSVYKGISMAEAEEILVKDSELMFKGDMDKDFIEFKRFQGKMGMSVILEHPFIYIRNTFASVFNILFKPIRSTIDLQLGFAKKGTMLTPWGEKDNLSLWMKFLQMTSRPTIALVLFQFIMLIILWPSFAYGMMIVFAKKEYFVFWLIALIVAYFSIIAGGPVSYARHRVPFLPFLAIGCGIGLAGAYERLKGGAK